MNYRQLGNGGAFDYKSVNSSFIIENEDKYLLFDCGYSVYAELRRLDEDLNENFNLDKLTSVYISHMDDDHIGSIKTLIFYMFFVKGKKLDIHAVDEVATYLHEYLERLSKYMNFMDQHQGNFRINDIQCEPTETEHHETCYGLIMSVPDNNYRKAIYITGDTKALTSIRNVINNIDNTYRSYVVFHDYSNWDDEENQVHACKSGTDRLYSDTTRSRVQWYHNNEPLNNKWQTV